MKFAEAEAALWASFGVAPTEQWLELPTGPVRCLVTGDGPTIVFVHGGSNSASSWINLVAQLPEFRCVLVDRPGCGLSPRLASPLREVRRFEAFADAFLGEVIHALGEASARVVATSFGSYFALRGAGARPERVERLVTLGYSIGAPITRVPPVMRFSTVPGLGDIAVRMKPPRAAVKPMLRQIGLGDAVASGAFNDLMIDWFWALLRDTDTMRNELRDLPPVIRPLRGLNTDVLLDDDVLGRVAMPTLMLWGRNDPMGGEETARAFAARLPSATLEMVDGGHAVWIDDAHGIGDRVRRFLA